VESYTPPFGIETRGESRMMPLLKSDSTTTGAGWAVRERATG
jgi:hypothetical protein